MNHPPHVPEDLDPVAVAVALRLADREFDAWLGSEGTARALDETQLWWERLPSDAKHRAHCVCNHKAMSYFVTRFTRFRWYLLTLQEAEP